MKDFIPIVGFIDYEIRAIKDNKKRKSKGNATVGYSLKNEYGGKLLLAYNVVLGAYTYYGLEKLLQ